MPTEAVARCDLVLFLLEDLTQHAVGGRWDLDRYLVRFQLDQRLIARHPVARRLEPAQDPRPRALGLLRGGVNVDTGVH